LNFKVQFGCWGFLVHALLTADTSAAGRRWLTHQLGKAITERRQCEIVAVRGQVPRRSIMFPQHTSRAFTERSTIDGKGWQIARNGTEIPSARNYSKF
jgi:hypothetical protein